MNKKEKIFKRLKEIVFHDVPVEKISFKTEYSTDFIIDFALPSKNNNDFEYWSLKFNEVIELKSDNLILNSESDIEIYSFDYELKEQFECNINFLLGFGQPAYNVTLKCENIELSKTERK